MTLNRQVLVLNNAYEPISVCKARRAIVLVLLGKAEVVELSGYNISTVSRSYNVPSVVRIYFYIHIPPKKIILTKKNVLKRDGYVCQYCGSDNRQMTVDHVIPRSYGGDESWENLVCACTRCNNIKGNQTPEMAGLMLRKKPRQPTRLTFISHFTGIQDTRWRPYLFYGN